MSRFVSFYRFCAWSIALGVCAGTLLLASFFLYLNPQLPNVEELRNVKLQTPLRIYASDNKLIAEFGEKRRSPIRYQDIPQTFINAVLAAEDARFYSHSGVDLKGLIRATVQLVGSGEIQSGGSTITMQVAKNFFLTRERTFTRKFNEILLALKIERELSKQDILELYFNKIFLGNRAYGIQAAAEVYYGKGVSELSLAETAMLAGLPKAPSANNPLANPTQAVVRRNWILGRMRSLDFIDEAAYQTAVAAPVTASYHGLQSELEAPYVAEMARKYMLEQYGNDAYNDGYRVYLTIDSTLQHQANLAMQQGLNAYTERHGYRGPEAHVEWQLFDADDADTERELLRSLLDDYRDIGILKAALVLSSSEDKAQLITRAGEAIELSLEDVVWARPVLDNGGLGTTPRTVSEVIKQGDIVRVVQRQGADALADDDNPTGWRLGQINQVQGALVSVSPEDGGLLALVGGFDFQQSKFNRAIQANRQPGSVLKPFIYAAGLDNGETAATLINDAPIVFDDNNLEAIWRPQNNDRGDFDGPTSLRQALYRSKNLVSIRLLRKTGIARTIDFVEKFGFQRALLPKDLSLALGSAAMPPMDVALGYARLANGGFAVEPYFIQRIESLEGNTLFQANPARVCLPCRQDTSSNLPNFILTADGLNGAQPESSPMPDSRTNLAPRVVDERIMYIMHSMLKDVIKLGTGRAAKALGRDDIAGKTGTTNDQKDAWFSGFNLDVATTVWVGFDQPKSLGRNEFGAKAALPIWMDFMAVALQGKPERDLPLPEGLVTVRIDPDTGKAATPGSTSTLFELFREEQAPATTSAFNGSTPNDSGTAEPDINQSQIF